MTYLELHCYINAILDLVDEGVLELTHEEFWKYYDDIMWREVNART